ncbi:MAG: YdcF family protein [Oscillospiraceae bacterium]|nr:YdcF family protein [Oscillospiraceae bacterium]
MHSPAAAILRALLLTASLAGILLFFLPMTAHIINIGNCFGLAVSVLLLLYGLFLPQCHTTVRTAWGSKAGKILLSAAGLLAAAGILCCAVLSILMIRAAHKKPAEKPQALIVLGCKVNGSTPSRMLSRRITAAYEAMLEYPELKAVVSGGQGDNEDISEAECMEKSLIRLGIAQDRILREDRSRSTSENLRFSKQILEENGITGQLLLVTDAYHQYRAQLLAKKEQLPDCAAVIPETSWYLQPTFWVREWFGLAHAVVFGN